MHPYRFLAASIVALFTLAAPALPSLRAADPTLDSAFVSTISPGLTPDSYPAFTSGTGAVNAVTLQSDGKIITGGNISRYKTPPAGSLQTSLKRLNPDGTLDTAFDALASTLIAADGQTEINALLTVAGDKIYAGGVFTSYQGTPRSSILRLHADGTLDPGFAATGLTNSTVGGNRYAFALAEQTDGKLLVGGGFNRANGTYRPNLARFHSDGTLDTTFNPNAALASSGSVNDIEILPDGKILVGTNLSIGNFTYRPALLRLNPDGSLDPAFNVPFLNQGGTVQQVLPLPDGRIVITGFLAFPGYDSEGVSGRIAAVHADGSLDTTFLANLGSGPNGWVGGELVLQPDGTLLAGGIFNTWNGQPRASIARLQPDGTLDPALALTPYEADRAQYLTHFYGFAVQPDGKIVVGGWFSRVSNPALETYNVTRINNEFSPASPGVLRLVSTAVSTAENAGSVTLQVSRFGGLTGAVSVNFATANGTATTGADYTAAAGTLSWAAGEGGFKTITIPLLQDTTAEPAETLTVTLSGATGGATIDPAKTQATVTLRDDDSAPVITTDPASVTLEQGANFTLSVRYDSVLPATVRWQYDPDGAGPLPFADIAFATGLDYTVTLANPDDHAGSYRAIVTNQPNGTPASTTSAVATVSISVPVGSVVTTFNAALPGAIFASSIDADGRIVVTGGTDVRRLTLTGAADPAFTIATMDSSITSVLTLSTGKILVGGFFNTVNGTAKPDLARLNADGTLDTAYAPALPAAAGSNGNLSVYSLTAGANDKYYVGFGSGGGLRRYLADGTLDATFTAPATIGSNLQGAVHAVRELPNGQLYVAHMSGANGFGFTYNLTRLNANGTVDATFVPPALNWYITGLDLLPDGRIAIAGRFSTVGGVAAQGVAILQADGSLDRTFQFSPGANGFVNGIIYRDGRLLIWGEFTQIAGVGPRGLSRLNLDGSADQNFVVGANNNVNTVAYTASGDIFVGGNFTTIKSVSRNYAALLVGNPQIGAIGFAPPRVSTVESAAPLTLTLRRYGPATEAVSVNYATADLAGAGAATSDEDYLSTAGTVSWAAGDSADKTLSVTLVADGLVEPTESFRVVLSNPSGPATVAASATITLLDADTPVAFTAQPVAPAFLIAGQNFTLSTTSTSPSPTTYQWFRNGVAIPDATSTSFARTGATLTDAGVYTLVATNAAGSVTSSPVLVAIRPQPGRLAAGQATSGRPNFAAISATPTGLAALNDGGALIGGDFAASPANSLNQAHLIRVRPDGSTDTTFSLPVNGPVRSLLRQPDGKILVGGDFTAITGYPVNATRILRLNTDLTVDATFAANTGAFLSSGSIVDFALDSTGRIYVAGGGGVVRYAADGTRDAAYSVTTTGAVTAIAVQIDDKLLLAGGFTNVNAANPAKYKFARLELDGSVDTTFTNSVGSSQIAGFNDLLVLTNGRILALGGNIGVKEVNSTGGTATNIESSTQPYRAIQSPDGKVLVLRTGSGKLYRLTESLGTDSTFNTGTGLEADSRAIAATSDGSIWIAGPFTTYNGVTTQGVLKLDGDPVAPAIVNPPANTGVAPGGTAHFGVGAYGTGLSYQWLKNGTPLADGDGVSGSSTPLLTIANADSADDADYTVAVTGGTPATTVTSGPAHLHVLGAPVVASSPSGASLFAGANLSLAAEVYALAPATYVWRRDGVIITDGGRFSGASTGTLLVTGATTADTGTYTLTVTNALGQDATTPVFVLVAGLPAGRAPAFASLASSSTVRAFLPLADGRMLVAGSGGLSLPPASPASAAALAYVNSDGTLSNLGRDPVTTAALPYVGGEIYDVVRQSDGKFVIGGTFTTVNGVAINRVARLHADGTLDTSFNPGTGAANTVNSLALDSSGRILVGGAFTNFAGVSGQSYLVRLDPATGALDLTLTAGVGGSVNKILALPDGGFLVGGGFFSPGQYLLRYDSAGARVTSFTPNPSNVVTDLALAPGGAHFHASFSATPYIARYSLAGSVDATFSLTGGSPNASVQRIAVQEDGAVVGFGTFNSPFGNVVRYRSSGALDTDFQPGTGFSFTSNHALALDSAGRIWLGGTFTTYNSATASRIVVLNGTPVTLGFARQPLARSVEAGQSTTFTAEAVANAPVTYQWFKGASPLADGPGVSGATTSSLTLSGLTVAAEGLYTVQASTSTAGPITSAPAELVFLAAPEILVAPTGGTFEAGIARTLTVTARGAGTLGYQWFRGTATTPISDISGATSATYTLNNPTAGDTSYYGVRVTNTLGEISSTPILLTFASYAGGPSAGLGLPGFNNGTLNVVIPLANGAFLAGGSFTSFTPPGGFSTTLRCFAPITSAGTLDGVHARINNTSTPTVTAMVRDSQGRTVFAGNYNTLIYNNANVTRYIVSRIAADGSIDTGWNSPFGNVSNTIAALAVDASDRVLVGGSFTTINSLPNTARLARLDATTGAVDATFVPPALANVTALRVLTDGRILVGTNSGVQLLEATGAVVAGFTSGTFNTIYAIHPLADGAFLLGTSGGLQKITSTGAVVSPFPATGTGTFSAVRAILPLSSGGFLIGGEFTTYNNVTVGRILAIQADGTAASGFSFGDGFNNTVNSLAFDASGRLWVGGSFTTYRGVTTNRLAVLSSTTTIPSDPGAPAGSDPFGAYLAAAGVPEGQRGATDDPDGDGIANLLEFALGLDPGDVDGDGLPVAELAGGLLTLTYDRAQPDHVAYEVQTTTDLANPAAWTATGVDQGTPAGDGITTASVPVGSGPRFLRLRVTLQAP